MKNFLDLFGGREPPGCTKPPGDRCGIVAGVMDYLDQDIDDQQWIRWQNRGGCGDLQLSSRSHLRCGLLWVRAQVNICILEALARHGPFLHQTPERVVEAKAELPLQLVVCLSGLRLLDQKGRGRAQSAMGGKADPAPGPQAPAIEVRDATQGVIAPRVIVTGEVTDGFHDAEDRGTRSGAECRAQIVEQGRPLAVEELVEAGEVLGCYRHDVSWNNYDSRYHNTRNCSICRRCPSRCRRDDNAEFRGRS